MKYKLLLISICFSLIAHTQDYKFGKVSKEELKEKYNPLDSSSSATYLYKHRKSYFRYNQNEGFKLITEIHERIKIYNQEGFNYATKIVGISKSISDSEELNNLKAYTYNLENGNIEKTKLDKHDIFETEESEYYDETKFTMPNIKSGSIIEYQYKIISPFLANVDEFVFQHKIPIKNLIAEFEVPEYFNFKVSQKGYLNVVPKNESKNDKIKFIEKTRTGGDGGMTTSSTSYSTSELNYVKNLSTFTLKNVPALKQEPFVNSINNYRSSVKYELSYTKFPNSNIDYYSTTWEDVVKTIYSNTSFGGELKKTDYYEDEIDTLISSISDPVQRSIMIFNFVKSKINWNGYYGIYTNDGVKKAFKSQSGNVAEINLMLTSMLRYAGIKAYPVLVSTRENGVPLFPTREGYNYVVSYVKLDNGGFLLDATSIYSVPNVLPYRTLNWQGRVIADHGGSTLIDLYPTEISKNNISMMVYIDAEGGINGSFRSVKTNHDALLFRERYNGMDEEDFLERMENRLGGLEISEYKVKNDLDLFKPLMESYKFIKEYQADIIGDKLYFSPMFYLTTNENPFKLDKREFPIDFGYPESTTYKIIINLPEGYKVESLPKPEAFVMPDKLGVFKYNISSNDKAIQLSVESVINQSIISSTYYDTLKAYFSQLVEKEAEQIVLTRI